jgi:histidine phosphotransferase ChpT
MTVRDLSALLGSRICHDLISPLGAIGNGIELLSLAGITAAPEIALISESVENANVRIRYFRIAFGAASLGQSIGASELHSLLQDMSRGSRLAYHWMPNEDLPRAEVKLAFLLMQCLESAMAWGGDIRVSCANGRWDVTGTADRLKIEPELWELLVDPSTETDVTAANVHFALVADSAARAGCRLRTDLSDGQIRISF